MALNSQKKHNWKELRNDWNKMLFVSGTKGSKGSIWQTKKSECRVSSMLHGKISWRMRTMEGKQNWTGADDDMLSK